MQLDQIHSQLDLSIVIPALREADNLSELLPDIHAALAALDINYEIIVVDESGDGYTNEVVAQNSAIMLTPDTEGYAGALVAGFQHAGGDYIITMDADHSHRPAVVCELWRARKLAEVVIASRYVPGGKAIMGRWRHLLSRILNILFSRGLDLGVRDMSSGFRIYARHLIDNFRPECKNFDILQELLVHAYVEGYRIGEIPFTYHPRQHGSTHARVIKFGLDYLRTFGRLWKLRNSIASADYDARAYDTWMIPQRYWQRQRYKHITELIQDQGPCLDVGSGSSRIIGALPQGSIVIDILMRKLRYSKKYSRQLVNANALCLPIHERSFPCVLCSQLIEHIPHGSVLEELDRVLIPGGRLVLGTPDYSKWQWLLIEWIYGKVLPQAYADEHITHYSYEELFNEFVLKRNYVFEEVRYILRGEMIMALRKPD